MSKKIPEGWKKVKLGEVAKIVGGGTPKTNIKEYWNGEVPWITPRDLSGFEGKYITRGERNISKLGLNNSSAKLLPKGTVLLSTRAPVGYLAIAKNEISTNQGFRSLIPNEKIDNEFLYYLLKNNVEYLKSQAIGTTFGELAGSTLKSLEFFIPPLTEQKAIVSVLSSLDDKIDLLHRQNQTLEKMAETLFRKCFIEDAKEDWEEGVFGDIVQPKKGKNITKEESIEGPYPVVAGGIEPSCYNNVANTNEPVVTISASGANAGYVRLYTTKVWSSDSSYIDYSITPYVYFSYIFLKINQKTLFDKQVGSAQPHVYPVQIMELDCPHYPESLISRFENWCNPIFTKIKYNQQQIRTLEQLRDTLLPKLMSGEIRVKRTDFEHIEKEKNYEK